MFEGVVHGNVAFMVVATVLVFFMTPGLAFFYGGLVEKKHALTLMLQIFISIGVVTLMWIFGGFSLVFGDTIGGVIGDPFQFMNFKDVIFQVNTKYGLTIPFLMFFMYQLMFAIITLPLMTGTIVNRITIGAWIKYLIIWMILVYFPVAHWIWGKGFLGAMGFVDFAGGTVIHVSAAFSGLGALLVLGRRKVLTNKGPFNMGLVAVGAGILMFGWFGFNAGGTLAAAGTTAIVFTNTGVAGAAGMIVWGIMSYIEKKRFSFLDPLIGAVAGLATITPASGYVTPPSAVLIGAVAGIVCFYAIKIPRALKWDDVLDVWGVHGVGGFIGTVMIGLLANGMVNGVSAGSNQLWIQLFGASLVAVYSVVVSYLIMKFLDKTSNIRVTKEQIEKGLDESLFSETYSDE
ncbi:MULTISPECIES: ammonium transporter [Cetobacterium]|jgi:Amt family ammonium transporter|uniref:Ammonium transporter n=1 Tax=Candidatus Cetobacterium colombiensis TaxID=3073100 RepID=A0ABU4W6T4_9FUSO|nr:ammonium transporter [Candidatus Cetobacterium colombiensis]MDX8335234.1 ammonium transporter [Candidatus Cetobacterium colombiensis]